MQRKTITLDGVTVTLALDDEAAFDEPGLSAISLRFTDGLIESIGVPSVWQGIPSMQGSTPTMEDLQSIAMLRIEYWPVLKAIVDDGGEARLAELAHSIGRKPPEGDGTFRWLLVVKEAVEKGLVTLDGAASSATPH